MRGDKSKEKKNEGMSRGGGGRWEPEAGSREEDWSRSWDSDASGQPSTAAGTHRSWPHGSRSRSPGRSPCRRGHWFEERQPTPAEPGVWSAGARDQRASRSQEELRAELEALRSIAAQLARRDWDGRSLFLHQLDGLLRQRRDQLTQQLRQLRSFHASLLRRGAPQTRDDRELEERVGRLADRLLRLERAGEEASRPLQLQVATLRPLDSPYAHVDQLLHAYAQPSGPAQGSRPALSSKDSRSSLASPPPNPSPSSAPN